MDPLSELQDDLTLDDTSEALNQLKLASIDEKNWPSDEMPDFPKSGGLCLVLGSYRRFRGGRTPSAEGRRQEGRMGQTSPKFGLGAQALLGEGPDSMPVGQSMVPAPWLVP